MKFYAVLAALALFPSVARGEGRKTPSAKQRPRVARAPDPPPERTLRVPDPAPLTIAPPPEPPRDAPSRDTSARSCALGDLCLGPVVSLGVVNAFGVGIVARYWKRLGLGVDYQMTPTVGGATRVTLGALTASARIYVTEGFFLYGGFARQSASVQTTESVASATSNAVLTGPAFGAGFMSAGGLVVGIDLGVMIPLSRDVQTTVETRPGVPPDAAKALVQARATAIANDVPIVPQLNVLRVGYMF